jgi:hypothetical protein
MRCSRRHHEVETAPSGGQRAFDRDVVDTLAVLWEHASASWSDPAASMRVWRGARARNRDG